MRKEKIEQKSGKKIVLLLLLFLTAAVIFGVVHLKSTERIDDGTISLYYQGTKENITISKLPLELVEGTRVNGKGEKIQVKGEGILLDKLLSDYQIKDYTRVKLIAADSYSAVVEKKEIREVKEIYLLEEEEGLRLVVFSDNDSKRSVSKVLQIHVE